MQTRSKTTAAPAPAVLAVSKKAKATKNEAPPEPPAVAPVPKAPAKKKTAPAAAPKKKTAKAVHTIVPDPPKKRPKGPKAKKVVPDPPKTHYTVDEILDIVRDWTTPEKIKELSVIGLTQRPSSH